MSDDSSRDRRQQLAYNYLGTRYSITATCSNCYKPLVDADHIKTQAKAYWNSGRDLPEDQDYAPPVCSCFTISYPTSHAIKAQLELRGDSLVVTQATPFDTSNLEYDPETETLGQDTDLDAILEAFEGNDSINSADIVMEGFQCPVCDTEFPPGQQGSLVNHLLDDHSKQAIVDNLPLHLDAFKSGTTEVLD